MFRHTLRTDVVSLVLRAVLGGIFLAHGLGKIEHAWGAAWEPALPEETQLVIAWMEVVAGALVLAGLFTRTAAAVLAGLAIGTGVVMMQFRPVIGSEGHGAGLNYDLLSIGAEYNIALLGVAVAVLLLGAGRMSVDGALAGLFRRKESHEPVESGLAISAH